MSVCWLVQLLPPTPQDRNLLGVALVLLGLPADYDMEGSRGFGGPSQTKAVHLAWWDRTYFGGVPAGTGKLSEGRATVECSGNASSASKADVECKNRYTQASG